MATAPKKTPVSESTFEVAMDRLQIIVAQMESAQLPLDELLERYEEGTQLINVCQQKLQAAEQRIEIVALQASNVAKNPSPSPAQLSKPDPDVSLF